MRIIEPDRSIIPACDVTTMDQLDRIIHDTHMNDKVGGYKVGVTMLDVGLHEVVGIIRAYTQKPIIYDHQKAGTDIPAMGVKFMDMLKRAGVDATILFPMAGPATEIAWIKAAQDQGLGVIVGGEMTHPGYLDDGMTTHFEGSDYPGFITAAAPMMMYKIAAKMGVTNFVVPGNKPTKIRDYRELTEFHADQQCTFFAPGFVAQGGEIEAGADAAGDLFHAIVGRGIYEADNIEEAVETLTQNL